MARGKRPVQRLESDDEESIQGVYFDAIKILKERGGQYLIEWEGKDKNGKPWEPSWEPKESCTSPLIEEWEGEKRRKKEKRQRAKSNETSSSHQPSITSSRDGEREASRDRLEHVVKPARTAAQYPSKELGKKRRRSPEPQVQSRRERTEVVDISDSEEETRHAVVTKHTNHKRRRLESPEIEFHESVTAKSVPNSRSIRSIPAVQSRTTDDESSSSSMSGPETMVAAPKSPIKRPPVPPSLRPIPQPSPTIFRKQLDSTLSSQIEQFSEQSQQGPKSKKPKPKQLKFVHYTFPNKAQDGANPVRERESLHSRLERAKQEAPERLKNMERMGQKKVLPPEEPIPQRPPQRPTTPPPKSPAKSGGDAGPLDESIVPSSLPEDMYPYEEMINMDEVPEKTIPPPSPLAEPEPEPEPVQKPSASPVSPKSPTRRSLSKQQTDEADLKLIAKDAMIDALETRIKMMQEDRERMEQRLEDQTRDFSFTKRNLEQEVASLTTALKQFGSIVGPAGVDAILKTGTSSAPPPAAAPSTSVDSIMQNPATNVYVRSEDDEQLINKLREENAKLQDTVLQLRAEKNSSEAMLNQVRDIALRAEATKTDLNRQVRVLTEIAKNAPKIAEEMYQSQITAAEEEVDKLKTQIEILFEQNRRTGDEVRKKASKSDTFSLKYRGLREKYNRVFDELGEVQDERENAQAEIEVLKTMIERIGGQAPSREDIQKLIFMGAAHFHDGSESGASSLPMFFKDDEHDGAGDSTGDNDGSSEEGESVAPENNDPVLAVEEVMSGVESVFDPPNLVMDDDLVVDERQILVANSTQSTNSNPNPSGTQTSDVLVWLCCWHTTEDSCTDHFTSKSDLKDHVLGTHVRV